MIFFTFFYETKILEENGHKNGKKMKENYYKMILLVMKQE